jgi:hypothetical protein
MKKSATDVMQEIAYAAVVDAVTALKASSKGVPNILLRDINALHVNTTFADLPGELQAAISASVRTAFARLLREGYTVAPAGESPPPRPPRPSGSPPAQHRPFRRPPPKREGSGSRPPGKAGGRPPRKPRQT